MALDPPHSAARRRLDTRARRVRAGGAATETVAAAPPARDGAALTVLIAADGREKTRLLEALADGAPADALLARAASSVAAPPTGAVRHDPAPADGSDSAAILRGPRDTTPDPAAASHDALLSARLRVAELRAEAAELGETPDDGSPPDGERVLQVMSEAPAYRARLQQLAGTRARLAAAEETTAACERRLAAFDTATDTPVDELGRLSEALPAWQERIIRARTAEAEARERAQGAATAARHLSARVGEELAREVFDGAHAMDVRWRRLWHLRRQLEEIWEVQSRAEAGARTLAEREAALRAAASRRRWRPSRRLLRFSGAAALAGSLIALWSGLWAGEPPDARQGALAGALIGVHGCLLLRDRLTGRREQIRQLAHTRAEGEIAELRRRRDRDWARAHQLSAAIEAGATALALPAPVTPDMIDTCEQAMAEALREAGGETPLTALLLELLAAEELAESAEARQTATIAERAAAEREWTVWRDAAGLPAALDAARIGEWLATRLQLADARAAQVAARAQLAVLEPVTAAWEDAARTLLAAAGRAVPAECCGRALSGELAALARRVRDARQRERQRHRLTAELRTAEAALATAQGSAAPAGAAVTARAGADGGGDAPPSARHLRLLEAAGAILAHATDGAYTGFRAAPGGGVLVVAGDERTVSVTAIPDRAARRCVQFLLRLGEALVAAPRPLIVDDALAGLDDDEAPAVARAIAALAATRPLIYVTSAAMRARALRLLPATARVLE